MSFPSPKIIPCFTVDCCSIGLMAFDSEMQALEYLWKHIQKEHVPLSTKISKAARKMAAASQNGKGYFDSGKPWGNGWSKATAGFRSHWCQESLRDYLHAESFKTEARAGAQK